MEILSYKDKVKTFKETELLQQLVTLQTVAGDLDASIAQIKTSGINLSTPLEQWVISRGIKKHLESQGYRGSSLLDNIQFCTAGVKMLCVELQKDIKGYNEKIWDGKLLTLKQTNILNLIEYIDFWLNYSGRIVDTLLSMNNKDQGAEKFLNKHDVKWIAGTEPFYRSFTTDLMKGSRVMVESLRKMQDADVNETTLAVLEGSDSVEAVDLLKKGFGVHLINPLFWFSLNYSKLQLRRIEQMRRRNEMLAMKISQAINKRNGGTDPQIEHQIEVYQNLIIKNETAIEEIEQSYA